MGLVRPNSGSVLVEGEDISRLNGKELLRIQRRMGMVFQEGALFDSLITWAELRVGILVIFSLLLIVWSVLFVDEKRGGLFAKKASYQMVLADAASPTATLSFSKS